MSLLDNLTARLPFGKAKSTEEHIFAVNIGPQVVSAALWSVSGNKINISPPSSADYSAAEELVEVLDKLLAKALGETEIEIDKVLFGVPEGWLQDDDLKPPYLKLLREIVRSLDLKPLAYVSTTHALSLFLEKHEGAPATTILAGIEEGFVSVTIIRAGKLDGTRVVKRGSDLGQEIEKALLAFSEVEVLPSKILLYGSGLEKGELEKYKAELLSYSWMSKLSFLHFPKVETLPEFVELQGISLAGAVELGGDIKYHITMDGASAALKTINPLAEENPLEETASSDESKEKVSAETLGFVAGDVTKMGAAIEPKESEESDEPNEEEIKEKIDDNPEEDETPAVGDSDEDSFVDNSKSKPRTFDDEETALAGETESNLMAPVERDMAVRSKPDLEEYNFEDGAPKVQKRRFNIPFLNSSSTKRKALLIAAPLVILVLLIAGFIFLPHANVTIFVEPKSLDRDSQVIADPTITTVDEAGKRIPGQIVQTSVTGSGSGKATGSKEVGNAAKGTLVIRNKTTEPKTFSKGTSLSGPNGLKFTLDSPVTVASISAEDGTWGKANGDVTADAIGPDSNLPTGSDFTIVGASSSDFVAKSEGNFSGGTSKQVTVVTDADQKKLLASVASDLRKQATDELQKKTPDKKILPEAMTEEITKKSYNKNINDQATDFTLNMTVNYKATAYSDSDLKTMIAKLVETNVPAGFEINLAESQTQSDVSSVDKNGKVTFLARFSAKLTPRLDLDKIKKDLRGKTPAQAADILKSYENVLGSEIKINPSLPGPLLRLPYFENNIKLEVSLK